MPIPKEILDVKRPTNTVVVAYGKNKDRYAVRKRVGCKNVNGRHIPINGPTIGHIVNYKYVPIDAATLSNISIAPIDIKDWANVVLCNNVFKNVQLELMSVYSTQDMLKLYCISILRVCFPGIKDNELKEAYETTFLSELYPDVPLSKNTVSSFMNNLGKASSRIVQFMRKRTAAVKMDHHLLVDRTLKPDESKVNSLSDFSWKAKVRGSRDISVLYAFDLETMEPVCSKCFPGNRLDVTSYEAFIAENGITQGIIVADKGFPSSAAEKQFKKHPNLHYLNPIKRNSRLIERHKLLEYTGVLSGFEFITFRKEKCNEVNKWLYSYRDSVKAAKEEQVWFHQVKKEGTYDPKEHQKRRLRFGTIVLECDLDLPPEIVYKSYSKRWEIELVMRYYKSACEFDENRVHDDYSVIGSEFCDFLSTVLTFRLINVFDKVKLLEQIPYKKVMSILARAKKARFKSNDWQLVRISPSNEKILQKVGGLEAPSMPPKRKRGRPKKSAI